MHPSVRVVSLLLFVSGLCALIFQTAWLREFRLIFGAGTPASAAVLAIFMGGLGLGNAWLGPKADKNANPLRMYGQLELAISLLAIVSPYLIQFVRALYIGLGGQESLGIIGASLVRLLLSALVIGGPVFLMGGTLAAAARAVTAADDESRHSVGWLYGLNTLGAVVGALASTFFLLERLGNRETLWAAAALNLGNGALAYWLSQRAARVQGSGFRVQERKGKKADKKQSSADKQQEIEQSVTGSQSPATGSSLIYFAAGVVGFVFLLMELVWYRMLGPILGGTTFTFGLILAVALAGIGVGGALYPVLFRSRVPTVRDFALTCAWEALALAIPLALGDRIALLAIALGGLRYFAFAGQVLAWAIVAGIVVFPAAVISGIQFPVLIGLLGHGDRDLGKHVGRAYACNTIGAMLGSLAGGFGLLPLATAPGAWRLAVIVLALTGLALLWAGYRRDRNPRPMLHPLAALLAAAACLLAVGPTAVWRHSSIGAGRAAVPASTSYNDLRAWTHERRRTIAWQADGAEASVAISVSSGIAFLVNGKSDGSATGDAATQIMFPLIGALVHPDPRESLVIGLGTGESAGWLAAQESMQHVDVVEIEPAIAEVAEACKLLNHDVLRHPKVRVVYNDAREFVQTTRRQYDLIASEPSNPYRAGVAGLYTLDFYAAVRRRLKPGGLFVQWLQGYEIDAQAVRTVLATLHRAFPHVEIWETEPADFVLVCGEQHPGYDAARLRARLAQPAMREALRIAWRTTAVEGILAHYVANETFVARVAAQSSAWPNTDNQNVLEFSFARNVGLGRGLSTTSLRREAAIAGLQRPPSIGEGIDWSAAEDQAIALYTVDDSPLDLPQYTGERAKRAEAMTAFFYDNPAAIATAWEAQPKPPVDLIETTALAYAYAHAASDKALPLLEKLRAHAPTDVLILESLLSLRQGRPAEAAERFERACLALRTDPTALRRLSDKVGAIALEIAEKEPKEAGRLSRGLSQPFALFALNDRRTYARCVIAQRVSPAEAAEATLVLEPNVVWDEQFLAMRYKQYEAVRHPLAAKAYRDLLTYQRHKPDIQVLTQP